MGKKDCEKQRWELGEKCVTWREKVGTGRERDKSRRKWMGTEKKEDEK